MKWLDRIMWFVFCVLIALLFWTGLVTESSQAEQKIIHRSEVLQLLRDVEDIKKYTKRIIH